MRQLFLAVGAVWLSLLSLVGCGGKGQSTALPCQMWNPSSISFSAMPGEQRQANVTLTACNALNAATVQIAPALSQYLAIAPTTIQNLASGTSQTFVLTYSPPVDATPTTTPGTIQLLSNSGSNTTTLGSPLTVSTQIAWANAQSTTTGISLSYPSFGKTASAVTSVSNNSTTFEVDIPKVPGTAASPQYFVTIIPSQSATSISDWFIANIDPQNVLIPAGTFTLKELPNNIEALVHNGPVPGSWEDGPVSEVYALIKGKQSIVVVDNSQTQSPGELGLTSASTLNSYIALLQTIVLP